MHESILMSSFIKHLRRSINFSSAKKQQKNKKERKKKEVKSLINLVSPTISATKNDFEMNQQCFSNFPILDSFESILLKKQVILLALLVSKMLCFCHFLIHI